MKASIRRRGWLAALLVCAAGASGCGGGLAPAFDARFPDEDRARLQRVRAQLSRAASASGTGDDADALLAATTQGAQPELLAYDLERTRVRWRRPFRASSRPEVLGDLVCSVADGHLFAFDAGSGAERFRLPLDGCAYVGGARSDDRLLLACRKPSRPGEQARARLWALDARSGDVLWRRDAQGEIGRPTASAGLVFVPYRRQSLSIIDARSGVELARVRARDDVIEWVHAAGGDVLFGRNSAHHLGAPDDGAAVIETQRLPGKPTLWPSAFEGEPGTRSARGRVALHFEPELSDGVVHVARGRFYALFYRYVFAYDAAGTLRWARMLPDDVISARALPSGLAAVTEAGQVLLLPSSGAQPQLRADLGVQLASARLSAGDMKAAKTAASGPPPLRRTLTEIALDPDNRLVPARAYALERLAELQEPDVTRDLLDIYGQSSTPPDLKRVVADALRARRSGVAHLVDALLARYDFIEQTRPAPLAVIVPALVEARETRAVPNLVARMFDHETPLAVLPAVVSAVATLGGDDALEPLLSFLRLYRADSSFAEQPEALIAAAQGVLAHGGEQGAAQLSALIQDGRASAGVMAGIAALLAPPEAAAPSDPALARAAPAPALPERLTDEALSATFAEHVDDLRTCIIDELGRNPDLAQVRLAFIAESDGSTHAWSFAPNTPELVDCLYPKTAAYRFPRFQNGREVVKYVIAVRAREPAAAQPAPADPVAEPWWQWYAQKPRTNAAPAHGQPWWRSHQPIAPLSLGAKRARGADGDALQSAPPPDASRGEDARRSATPAQAASSAAPAPATGTAPARPAAPTDQPSAEAEDTWWVPAPDAR